jgi:hypothetical protein
VVDRLIEAVVQTHPYALCFGCLAMDVGCTEFDTREAAQLAVFGRRLHVVRRVCYRCHRTDDVLIVPAD